VNCIALFFYVPSLRFSINVTLRSLFRSAV
jgi:hypothetical protein